MTPPSALNATSAHDEMLADFGFDDNSSSNREDDDDDKV